MQVFSNKNNISLLLIIREQMFLHAYFMSITIFFVAVRISYYERKGRLCARGSNVIPLNVLINQQSMVHVNKKLAHEQSTVCLKNPIHGSHLIWFWILFVRLFLVHVYEI